MKRVLVVDDEEDVRQFASMILEGAGFAVECAGDGREALESIDTRPPDLVVLDLMMPVLDGWGVLDELRKRGAPPPAVVILSAYSDPERATRAGAAASLSKPFDVQ